MNARAKKQTLRARPKLRLIHGGLPPEHEWTEAAVRRIMKPSIKQLPFVQLKPNAEPLWEPNSYWYVSTAGRWGQAYRLGQDYARQAVAAMQADGFNVLPSIFRDMIDSGIEHAKQKKGRRRGDVVMLGFLHQLGHMFSPIAENETQDTERKLR
jgi:hypothetical protein